MILKQSWIHVSDNTNVRWLRTFHLYKGFHRRCTTVGFFIKGSARIVEPPRLEYKGFKFKFNKKGDICRAILVRCALPLRRLDGSVSLFTSNSGILIKKNKMLNQSTYKALQRISYIVRNLNLFLRLLYRLTPRGLSLDSGVVYNNSTIIDLNFDKYCRQTN